MTRPLPTEERWTGPVAGAVQWTFDPNFRVVSGSLNGAAPVSFTYDADGLLTGAGALALTRDAPNGSITSATVGSAVTVYTYDGFGALASQQTTLAGAPRFSITYTRDALGRIQQKTETLLGVTRSDAYAYDRAGRLTTVTRDGAPWASYTYDPNGNRLSETTAAGTVAATYDAQDRLVTYGTTTYTYTAAGDLHTRTTPTTGTTTYTYDALGNLTSVALPTGTVVSYVIDGANRRIGRRIDGALVQGFLHEGQLRRVAELDGTGAVVSRFVYAKGFNVPDYLVRGGVTYRIITDHLGSPRLVVNAATGAVAQQLDYDPFGRVVLDTNPGFQPFGFAGGLYDPLTRLVRFGARDYDAETARWTVKDPVLFSGAQVNLYAYVGSDPVNLLDRSGLWTGADDAVFPATGALVGLAGRAVGDVLTGKISSLEDYIGAAVGGAVGGDTLLYTANPFLAGAAGGLSGNLTGQGLKRLTGKKCRVDVGSAVFDTVFGAAAGFIPGRPRIPGVNSGQGSALQVFREMVTKASNGTIGSMSWETAGKMAPGAYYEYAFGQGAAAGALGSTVYGYYTR